MGTGTGLPRFLCPEQEKKGKGIKAVPPALVDTREYEQSDRPESVADGGWFEVLWNLEYPVGLRQKRNVCISMKKSCRNFDSPSKNKNCGTT